MAESKKSSDSKTENDVVNSSSKGSDLAEKHNAQLKAENEELKKNFNDLKNKVDTIMQKDIQNDSAQEAYDPDDFDRVAPEGANLRCYEGAPIVKTKLIEKEEKDENGNMVITSIDCELETLTGEKATVPYGSTSKSDYLNLEKKRFDFVDVNDKTGASKVETETVNELGVVRRRDPSNIVSKEGDEQSSGPLVKQVVRKRTRYYTIEIDGEKHELHESVLSK